MADMQTGQTSTITPSGNVAPMVTRPHMTRVETNSANNSTRVRDAKTGRFTNK